MSYDYLSDKQLIKLYLNFYLYQGQLNKKDVVVKERDGTMRSNREHNYKRLIEMWNEIKKRKLFKEN